VVLSIVVLLLSLLRVLLRLLFIDYGEIEKVRSTKIDDRLGKKSKLVSLHSLSTS